MKVVFTQGLKKYVTNTGYLFLEKFLRMMVSLAVWAVVIRYLGPEQYGLFSYALSFVFLFSILSNLGLDSVVIRDLINNFKLKNEILGTAFFLKLMGAILAIILIVAGMFVFNFDFQTKMLIIIVSLHMIFQAFDTIDFYFQSQVLSKYPVYSQLFSLVIVSILYLIIVLLKKPLICFSYIIVIETIFTAMGLIFFYKRSKQIISYWQFDLTIMKKLIKDSFPLVLIGISISIYMRIDQIMIKTMLDSASVGYYSAVVRIAEVFNFIPIVITGSLFPAVINAKLKEPFIFQNRLRALFSILLWASILISVFITLLSAPLILFLYGGEYLTATNALILYIWSSIPVFLGVARSKWAIVESLQIYLMFYAIIGAVLNVVLNFLLIPIFGINGAATATVVSYFFVAFFSNLLSKKTRPIFTLQLSSFNIIKALKSQIY